MKLPIKKTIISILDLVLSQPIQERLGHFIISHARGEGNDVAESNGEYALLRRIANSGLQMKTIFDVGANKGEWTVEARAFFGGDTQIFAFEPVRETYAFLTSQLAALPAASRTYPIHLALGDTDNTATINVSGHLAGSNSIFKRHGTQTQSERIEQVPLQRGDSFCRARGISRINLLKIDTEGNEMAVLHGFDALLAMQAVDVIQFEYGGTWIDSRSFLGDAFIYLHSRGYRLGKVLSTKVIFYAEYDQRMENFAYSNWVAVKSEMQATLQACLS